MSKEDLIINELAKSRHFVKKDGKLYKKFDSLEFTMIAEDEYAIKAYNEGTEVYSCNYNGYKFCIGDSISFSKFDGIFKIDIGVH